MNNFKKRIECRVPQNCGKQNNNFQSSNFDMKMYGCVISALSDLQTSNVKEEMRKVELMMNLNRVFEFYEELRPLLTSFFQKNQDKY